MKNSVILSVVPPLRDEVEGPSRMNRKVTVEPLILNRKAGRPPMRTETLSFTPAFSLFSPSHECAARNLFSNLYNPK